MDWVVNGLPANPPNSNLTPSHQMLDRSGQYLGTSGQYGPYRSFPGSSTDSTELSCRKSFNIFMTDGAWNTFQQAPYWDGNQVARGGGNADGSAKTFPDGTSYTPFTAQTNLYSDTWGIGTLSTLSDLAFHYWSTDLQPGLTDNVRKSITNTGPETIGGTTLEEYWNPKNNPANWQHMVTYAIGFNTQATTWLGNPTYTVANGMYGGPGYHGLVNGTATWVSPLCRAAPGNPDTVGGNVACDNAIGKFNARANYRSSELWHMALNGRGKFVPAPNAASLVTAFNEILDDILTQTASPLVSIATSSSRLRADDTVYIAGYDSERWSGQLGGYAITAGTNVVASSPSWVVTSYLDASTSTIPSRLIATANDAGTAARSFVAGSLTTAQLSLLGSTTTLQSQLINYTRGDRSQEGQYGGSLRNRASRLGDIINSNIWLTGKPTRLTFEHNGHLAFRSSSTAATRSATLYVGANDGMLHAFNAADGVERFAYIPKAALPKLSEYASASYAHSYSVDGHPFTGDADLSFTTGTTTTANWKTVLVSGLGAGGRGYFVLDVTNPNGYNSSNVGSLVIVDKTLPATTPSTAGTTESHDLGHIFATPVVDPISNNRSEQIVKLNNGRWAVIMGNGVNSANERPVLLIQYLDGTKGLLRIVANSSTGQGNGLSAPRILDIDGNGTADVVYAGDLKGNVWKFDLSHSSQSSWGVAKFSGTSGDTTCKNATTCVPLFQATDSAGNAQPITSAPLWMAHPIGGIQVLVGTGINVTDSHRSNTSTQTLYSVWDKARYAKPTSSSVVIPLDQQRISGSVRSMLVTQTVASAVTSTLSGTTTDTDYFNSSENDVPYSWTSIAAKRGWFMDLPASRERVLNHPQIFEGQKVLITSHVPKLGASGETCDFDTVTEDNWINVLNMISGKPSSSPVFSVSDTSMNLTKSTRTRIGSGEYITINRNDGGKDIITLEDCGAGSASGTACTDKTKLNSSTVPGARADWREIR